MACIRILIRIIMLYYTIKKKKNLLISDSARFMLSQKIYAMFKMHVYSYSKCNNHNTRILLKNNTLVTIKVQRA